MSNPLKQVLHPRILIGFLFVLWGILLLLDRFGLNLHYHVLDWWPVVLILIGLGHVYRPASAQKHLSGWIWMAAGLLLLGNNLDLYELDISDVWPFFIILIGLAMIRHAFTGIRSKTGDDEQISLTYILSGGTSQVTSQSFRGGTITTVMGGTEVNLREAGMMGDEILIDVLALWGGIKLMVPVGWQVVLRGTPILGSMKTNIKESTSKKRLIITGTIIMGSVEVGH